MKTRDSRFEVLRIFSIFLIIIYHFSLYVPWHHSVTGVKTIGAFVFLPYGQIGVKLFGLITGYFMIQKKDTIYKNIRKIKKVWLEVFFYSLVIEIILQVVFGLRVINLVKSMLPMLLNEYWFATAYVLVVMLSPFINLVIVQIDKKMQATLLILCVIMSEILPVLNNVVVVDARGLMVLITSYIVGAYIHQNNIHIKNYINMICVFGGLISIYLSYFILFKLGFAMRKIDHFSVGILSLIVALGIFSIVVNRAPFYSRGINLVATTTFASYLISEQASFRSYLWNNIFNFSTQGSNLLNCFLLGVLAASSIMVFSFCIDFIRQKCFLLITRNYTRRT
ncbi:acyltransferase family protein [Latilactobacillus curvatus]|uniref:acyltransferase family protein n=1 Tax=Latilactobacillus curvatus TaxID=28038 RepID=UPI002410811F|nr:acyltransferase family protein [Latilactobacillus curvatus]MDG2980661.1 hypothetical protein [Latilactobacillus curvatus]MDT3394906.1 hypothetical protein [Bacillota bacterium]